MAAVEFHPFEAFGCVVQDGGGGHEGERPVGTEFGGGPAGGGGPGGGDHVVGAAGGWALWIGEMEGWGWKWDVHILRPYFRRIGFRKRSGVLVPNGNELRGIKLSKDRGAIGGN